MVEGKDPENVQEVITAPVAMPLPARQIVYFDFDSDALTTESKNTLTEVLKTMNHRVDLIAELHGHTDERGNKDFNHDLSRRRAEAVENYLLENQLDTSKLKILYFGETKPAAKEAEVKDHHQLNRRVEIIYRQLN